MRIIYKYRLLDAALNFKDPQGFVVRVTVKEGAKLLRADSQINLWIETDTDRDDQTARIYCYATGQELFHDHRTHKYFTSVVLDTKEFHILHLYVPHDLH